MATGRMGREATKFDDDLLRRVEAAVQPGAVIVTLGISRPNRVVSVAPDGILVETERSAARGTGPQLVPAWMVQTAWDHLRSAGTLTQDYLMNVLNVKRSAFVCALLAQLPDVDVQRTRPITLVMSR